MKVVAAYNSTIHFLVKPFEFVFYFILFYFFLYFLYSYLRSIMHNKFWDECVVIRCNEWILYVYGVVRMIDLCVNALRYYMKSRPLAMYEPTNADMPTAMIKDVVEED